MEDRATIQNCPLKFHFQCSKQWMDLLPTEQATVRFCTDCQHEVFYCESNAEILAHARAGHCIAREVPGDDGLILGRVNPRRNETERQSTVRQDKLGVSYESPGRSIQFVEWDAIQSIEMRTPRPDRPPPRNVCLALITTNGTLDVSRSANGFDDLLKSLQDWPGFNHEAAVAAMKYTDYATFLCWRRPAS